ncbi:MAG: hypothetical protein HC795_19385 [Coleofasciculaceae cyanobacterium RL_1_1]|nr:hypothetical protein [Coleofasciculaceae cyanobacterium RL_1_1]
MSVSLVNVAKYYKGLSQQDEALAYLEQELRRTNPELLDTNSEFATIWRNPGGQAAAQVATTKPGAPSQVNLPVPYLSQLDNVYKPQATSSLTSVAMCMAFFGRPALNQGIQLEDELFQYCEKSGLARQSPHDLTKLIQAYGYNDRFDPKASWSAVKDWLAAGNPIITHGWFTKAGHIVVIRGYSNEGWIVNDPRGQWFEWGYNTSVSGQNLVYSYGMMQHVCGTDGDLWIHFVSK